MSYLVFARKFRPQRFEDLLGQEPVVVTLRHAIEQQRVGQAYLFAGPRGTGKTSTARIFAKALNCEKGFTPTPCNRCVTCVEITEGRSLDVIEIDGASNALIDNIRDLRENVKFAPIKGRVKVYIIDECHQIKADAFNALLKTLEEPPAHVKFIFATTAVHKVPATILSRCQRYEFKRIPQAVILEKLKEIVKQEKVTVPPEALSAIARAAAGSLRDAESLLDQLAAFGQGTVQMADVQTLLGVVEDELLAQAIEAISQRQPEVLLQLVAQLVDAGRDLTQFLQGLLGYLRNLMVAKLGEPAHEILNTTPEIVARLTTQAAAFSEEELSYLFYLFAGTSEVMRRVGDLRTPLEVALLRAARREPIARIGELIRQLEERPSSRPQTPDSRLQTRDYKPATKIEPQKGSDPVRGQTPIAVEEPPSSTLNLEEIKAHWPKIIGHIQQRKMSTAAYLLEAQPVAVSAGALMIGFPKAFLFHKEALDRPEHRGLLEDALRQVAGWTARVQVEVVEDLTPSEPSVPVEEPAAPEPPPPERVEQPPIVRSAAELFGGRVTPPRR